MADLPRIPGLTSNEYRMLKACWMQLRAAMPGNELRTGYYELSNVAKRISNVVPPQYYQAASTLGWNARAVDKLAERSAVDGVAWAAGSVDDLGWIEIERENYARSEFASAILASLTHGVSWLVVSQGMDSSEPDVMIHAYDALSASGLWNGRTRSLDAFMAVSAYDSDGNPSALTLWVPGEVIVCRKAIRNWSVQRSEHNYGVPVTPIVYRPRPPRRPFGYSRITRSTMDAQDRAVRTLVRLEGMSDIYSFAEQIVIGADPEAFVSDNNPWARVMGRWKGLPDDADTDSEKLARAEVQQLNAQSPQPHLDAFRLHAGIFSGETGIPITELGIIAGVNQSTTDASENAQQQLIDAADMAKDEWLPRLQKVIVDALAMKNRVPIADVPSEWRSIEPVFRDSRFISRAAAADAGLKLIQSAPWLANTSVGLSKLGLSRQEIDVALAERERSINSTGAPASE